MMQIYKVYVTDEGDKKLIPPQDYNEFIAKLNEYREKLKGLNSYHGEEMYDIRSEMDNYIDSYYTLEGEEHYIILAEDLEQRTFGDIVNFGLGIGFTSFKVTHPNIYPEFLSIQKSFNIKKTLYDYEDKQYIGSEIWHAKPEDMISRGWRFVRDIELTCKVSNGKDYV